MDRAENPETPVILSFPSWWKQPAFLSEKTNLLLLEDPVMTSPRAVALQRVFILKTYLYYLLPGGPDLFMFLRTGTKL